ncbi:PhoQ sensor [Fragilaria crotonensis]|nr:PhoQ sensor [Fragilaria crotonensis]
MGPDFYLLSKAISGLSALAIDDEHRQETQGETKNESAFVKFKVACKCFLHAISSEKHPIVLFIDDIQWMDEGSKQLLAMLLDDQHWQNVLLVFAYREEDANTIADSVSGHVDKDNVLDIRLENLDGAAVHQLVSSQLGPDSENKTRELSELLWQKTAGNPFHILQLFESIQSDGLLKCSSENQWQFDIDKIRRQTQVSDSLADLLLHKVQRLSPFAQKTCMIASLRLSHGRRYSRDVVFYAFLEDESRRHEGASQAFSLDSATVLLLAAIDAGFLERTKEDSNSATIRFRLAFSRWFRMKKRKIAPFDRGPAKYCKEKSAFIDAVHCLRRGLELIDGESKWTEHFDLAFELMELLAKTELIVGNFDSCKEVTRDVLLRSKSVHQQLNLLLINMEVRMAENDVDQSIAAANESLILLGVKVPSRISMLHVMLKLFKVKRLLGRKSDQHILALPLIENQLMASAIVVLFNASAYFAMKNAENETLFYSLLAVELTLRYGLSPYSAPAFAVCGMIEVFLGNHMRGYRFGKLALAMLEKMKCKEVECATLIISTSLSSHFQEPINGLIGSFDHAMDAGLESGDVVWGIYSLSVCVESRCMIGQNLAALEEYQRERYQRAAQFGQDALLRWSEPSMQYVLNLQCCSCNWRDLLTLSGEIMDEDEYTKFGVDANNELILWTVWFFKMQLAYQFGVYHVAERFLPDLDRTGDTAQANFSVPLWYYLAASIHYELYHRFPSEKRAHLKAARKYHKAVKRLDFSPNSTPFLTLLAAEELSSRGKAKPEKVVAAYSRAIGAMAATGWANMEGLANERVGFYMVRVGDLDLASAYFDRAMHLYRYEWGALAKYEWLLEQSEQLLGDRGESQPSLPTAVLGKFQTCS